MSNVSIKLSNLHLQKITVPKCLKLKRKGGGLKKNVISIGDILRLGFEEKGESFLLRPPPLFSFIHPNLGLAYR